jgi:hypothetical protein
MLDTIIQDFAEHIKIRCSEIMADFTTQLDFTGVEKAIAEELAKLSAQLQQAILNALLLAGVFLSKLKIYAGTCGQRFKEYRYITVSLSNGKQIKVKSPYFVKAKPHSRRKKRGPNGTGSHVGLKVLGFIGQTSPGLLADALQTALLCPSYEVASTVLKGRGISLDVKTRRRLCQLAGNLDVALRGRISLSGNENLSGQTLVIGIDGGRLRERRRKRGRKAKGLKRQGYHAEWKEPKLFTLYLMDAEGNLLKEFEPLHDATMGNHEDMFALLESHLRSLELEQLDRLVFCGDGGKWIWSGIEKLCERMSFDKNKVFQALDYTHAKQNLQELVDLVDPRKQSAALKKWRDLLWNGQLDALKQSIEATIVTNKTNREQALKKFNNFFEGNKKRMHYAQFKEKGLPTGSGHVESAIRRVINLRLKAPGTFWLKEMAECFLFLRSQLISGRWNIFMGNLTALTRRAFETCLVTELTLSKNMETA